MELGGCSPGRVPSAATEGTRARPPSEDESAAEKSRRGVLGLTKAVTLKRRLPHGRKIGPTDGFFHLCRRLMGCSTPPYSRCDAIHMYMHPHVHIERGPSSWCAALSSRVGRSQAWLRAWDCRRASKRLASNRAQPAPSEPREPVSRGSRWLPTARRSQQMTMMP